jgi:flagellar biosynthetic protein FliP
MNVPRPRKARTTPRWVGGGMILLAWAGLAAGQEAAGPTTAPTTQPAANSLPKVGEILDAVEKASAGKEDQEAREWSSPVKLAVVFVALALLPSVLVMMTSFTRIVIVLGFVRRALTTQNIPPTIAIIGLALFLTIFTMSPTFAAMNVQALQPYLRDEMSFEDACAKGNELLKEFMLRQTRHSDLALFVELGGIAQPATMDDVPTHVAVPSFAISEFRTAFEMGCLLFIPFLLIDLVVASILLSTGMMMLPPVIVSLPFKIILFVLVDGWGMMARTLVRSFNY